MTPDRSPRVVSSSWGSIEVETLGTMRDAKLWPGGGRAWDWRETGTRHEPGVQPVDLDDLLARHPTVVVLSQGRERRLGVCPETLAVLARAGVEVVRAETGAAIDRYNALALDGSRVAALLHSTC